MPWWGWMLIVIAILVVILVVLYIVGNRLQKKQSAQKEAMLQAAQPVTMLVIDKKMLPMKDANLPKQVLESTPKRYQKAKLPIVKAKIGPQIINLICDDGIFDVMPVRGEVKAMVSGIYITSVKNVRGKKAPEPAKKSFSQKLRAKISSLLSAPFKVMLFFLACHNKIIISGSLQACGYSPASISPLSHSPYIY